MWRRKFAVELDQMVTEHDWRKWKAGPKELRRRGRDIEKVLPLLLERMLLEKRMGREVARFILRDMDPRVRPELRGYPSADHASVSRERLTSLLARDPPNQADVDLFGIGLVF